MADPKDKVPHNVGGRFFVDDSCIYCELCVETAPTVFRYAEEDGWAYVFAQPRTAEEIEQANEALLGCPTESIGDSENPGIEFTRHPTQPSARKWWQIWK